MAINAISPLADSYAIRRQNTVRDPGAQAPAAPQAVQPRPDARLARAMQSTQQQGAVTPAAANTLPREGARLLETEQAGRTTSTLLSGMTAPGQPAGSPRPMAFAQPAAAVGAGGALSAMRTAEEVMQAVGTATPSAQNIRIANEAYQMEAQAQRDFQTQRAARSAGTWEWFA